MSTYIQLWNEYQEKCLCNDGGICDMTGDECYICEGFKMVYRRYIERHNKYDLLKTPPTDNRLW